MSKYQSGKIYKIVCNITEQIYIGSTTQPLNRRLSQHRSYSKKHSEGIKNRFCTSHHIIKGGDYHIELIENYPCDTKKELNRREGCVQLNTVCVNRIIAGRTSKEWAEANKELIQEKNKIYYQNNKEKAHQYYIDNIDEIKDRKKIYMDQQRKILIKSKYTEILKLIVNVGNQLLKQI